MPKKSPTVDIELDLMKNEFLRFKNLNGGGETKNE